MKKLVMLLVVLALCVPTYGYILVYKLTMSGTAAELETDGTKGWLLRKASGVGYLVLDVDDDDPNVLYDVQFVDYRTETEEDHTKHKLYEMWDTGEEFAHSILQGLPPKGKNIASINIDLSTESGTMLGGKLLGTVKSTDIGTLDEDEQKEKKDVATSLKGVGAWEDYEDDTLAGTGYGTLTLTLDSKWTKTANNPDEEKGFYGDFWSFLDPESDAPQGLISWLESKGYESAQVSATPTAPTGVTASAGDGQVSISWSAVSGATSYNIYWSTTSGVTKTNGTKITGATSPYSHTGRTNGTTYYYVVTAENSYGESSESSEVSATPQATGTAPSAPTGVTASAGDGQVTISWSAVSGATSYNIYWSTTSGVTKTNGTKITGATSPYTHTGRTNGTTYYYVVTAVNSYGESSESSQVSAMPRAWTISTIDTTGNVGQGTSIAVDANKKVHISYYDITNEKLKYATNLSGSWVVTTIANAPSTAYGTSIAIDTNGKVHISYEGTVGNLMYATNSSGSWVTTVLESSAWSADVSLALDSNNKVHISYFNLVNFDLKYATNTTDSWTTSIIVNGGAIGPLPGYSTSIDVDSNNKVHISYYDDSSPDSIKYITNASGTWQITTIGTIGLAAGWETSLVVDSSNKVHISYYNWTNDALKYATNSSGVWETYTIDNTSGNVWDASITVDSNKYVHLSYNSYAGLMYATNSSGSWVVSKVDEAWTGSYNSVAVDNGGGVHISYYDGYNSDLKYATK